MKSASERRLEEAFRKSAQVRQLLAEGYHLYRENFRWGRSPAFRTADKQHYRFIDDVVGYDGPILTPYQLLTVLLYEWEPIARDDLRYRAFEMRNDLEAIPE